MHTVDLPPTAPRWDSPLAFAGLKATSFGLPSECVLPYDCCIEGSSTRYFPTLSDHHANGVSHGPYLAYGQVDSVHSTGKYDRLWQIGSYD